MRKLLLAWVLSCISIMLGGCGLSTPVKVPVESMYVIMGQPSIMGVAKKHVDATLLVSMPIADPGYDTSQMIYVTVPYKLKSFVNHRWVASPALMIAPILAQQIRQTHYFHAVVTVPFSGYTRYRLDTVINKLQQEFLQPTSVVRLEMIATVVDNKKSNVLASRHFQVLVKAPGDDPYSGVIAANKAVTILSRRITSFAEKSIY